MQHTKKLLQLKSIHPFEPHIPKDATKIIIGTIPPSRFCKIPQQLFEDDVNFYYGSKDNSFWFLVEKVFFREIKDTENSATIKIRKGILNDLKIGITDIIETCTHENDSASDKDLKDIKHKDLGRLLAENNNIQTLIYTSNFVKKQINNAFKVRHKTNKSDKTKQIVKINGKEYNVQILYSPSRQALINLGENGKEKREKQYEKILLEK
jgi:G:T/U-mismatch repair DNA glycosylase